MEGLSKKYLSISCLILLLTASLFVNAQSGNDLKDHISIGLLVNNQNEISATCSAEMAVKKINDLGGIKGKPLKLIIRSVEGSWGTGSGEVVDLVFNEEVLAILGSIDGRNSHLAEQVIAKTQVIYLSAWASDPSLSKAYVPWYFSLVPNDDQQTSSMIEEISKKSKIQHLLVVHDSSYDTGQALKSLERGLNRKENLKKTTLLFKSLESFELQKKVENDTFDAIILLGRQTPVTMIVKQLAATGKNIPVYTNLAAQESTGYLSQQQKNRNEQGVITSDFEKIFLENCKRKSGPVATYTYDGIMILADILKKSGKDQGSLLQNMSQINYQGVTGVVEFDSRGRLKNTGELLLIKE